MFIDLRSPVSQLEERLKGHIAAQQTTSATVDTLRAALKAYTSRPPLAADVARAHRRAVPPRDTPRAAARLRARRDAAARRADARERGGARRGEEQARVRGDVVAAWADAACAHEDQGSAGGEPEPGRASPATTSTPGPVQCMICFSYLFEPICGL